MCIKQPITKALLHFDNSSIEDLCGNTWSSVGTSNLNTSIKKFGNSSLYCSGSNRILWHDTQYTIKSKSFTVECWMYPTRINSGTSVIFQFYRTIYNVSNSGTCEYGLQPRISTDKTLKTFYSTGSSWITADILNKYPAVSLNVWHHIACSRDDNYLYSFLDGILFMKASFYNKSLSSNGDNVLVGGTPNVAGRSNLSFIGYIDEFRVSNICRYTENFALPTEPFELD